MKNNTTHTTRGSTRGLQIRPKAAALAVAACFSSVVWANPTNPTVVHGTATFQQAGNILNVTNSHNAIINWGSFSIGINELTRFIQPSALSAVLNRVTGQDPSAILGALQSNGKVFLLNPNGIVFGAGSQINVAGLVASTLNLSNADFLAGRMNFTDGAGAGSVLNQGSINAAGGPVYMVGNAVTNQGIITSPGGEVILAAGNSVELVNPGTPNLRVEIQASNNEARNLGSVVAEAGRIGIYAGLIKQGGVLNANSAVAEGGRIMLKSTKRTDLEAGSVTSAKGTTGGEIIALSDMNDGVTQVSGKLDASATNGNGGFIETSAAKVKVADSAVITTAGGNGGVAGTWLIDPSDFLIASYGGDISGSALGSALNSSNVSYSSAQGSGGSGGNVLIQDNVAWSSGNTLTLTAVNDIMFGISGYALDGGSNGTVVLNAGGSVLTNGGGMDVRAGTLNITAGNMIGNLSNTLNTEVANANLSGGSIDIYNHGALTLLGAVATSGSIAVKTSDSITAGAGATINAVNGDVQFQSYRFDLSPASVVMGNSIKFQNYGDPFIIGPTAADTLTAASFDKMQLNAPASGSVIIDTLNLSITAPITLLPAKAERLDLIAPLGISQTVGGAISVKKLYADGFEGSVYLDYATNSVDVLAGRAQENFYFKNTGNLEVGAVGAHSGIQISNAMDNAKVDLYLSSGDLTINSAISVQAYTYSSDDVAVRLRANAGSVTINAPVSAMAGSGNAEATVDIYAKNNVTINSAGSITAASTNNGYGDVRVSIGADTGNITMSGASQIHADGNEGDAEIDLNAGGNINLGAGTNLMATTDSTYGWQANINLTAGGNITQNAGITADGGEYGFASLSAGGSIMQTDPIGFIRTASRYTNYSEVYLSAGSGIGTRANPIRIDDEFVPEIYAINSGSTGDIALSFFNSPYSGTYGLTGLIIDGDLYGLYNSNPNGMYYVKSETDIVLAIPFMPNNLDLLPGQKVVLDAPNGQIRIGADGYEGYTYGSIMAGAGGGTGNVELIAGGKLTIESGSFVTGHEPLIKAGDLDVQGAIRSGGNFIDIRHFTGGPIHLGFSGDGAGGALALDTDELNRMTGWNGTDDPLDPGAGVGLLIGEITGGPLIFKGSVGPTTSLLNVRGSTVTQEAGVITGALIASAQSGVSLTGSNQISYITGGLSGSGNFTVYSSAPMEVGGIATPGGNISVNSSGGMTLSGQLNAGAGTVTLSTYSGSIADNHVGIDIIANSAVISASYGGSVGSIANPLETSVLNLSVTSSAGGGQEVGIINAGNLNLTSLNFGGSLAAIAATGTLTTNSSISSSSGISLSGSTGLTVSNNIYAGQLSLNSGSGVLLLDDVMISASSVTLTGNNISVINDAYIGSGGAVTISAAGNLVVGDSNIFGGNNVYVTTGGDVNVTRGTIHGSPDVFATVGGQVFINGTLSEPGKIAAGSPSTINLNFPNLSGGGFTINGLTGIYYDPATGTGFFANGSPASPGAGLSVTYGTGTSTIPVPTDTLIVAMTQAAKPPAEQQSTGTSSSTEDDKDKTVKKGTMVCR